MIFELKVYKAPQGISLLRYDVGSLHDAIVRAEAEGFRFISGKKQTLLLSLNRRYRFPLALFTQELFSLLEAGLPLLESIETLAKKERSAQSRVVYSGLNRLLSEGLPLSQAMKSFTDFFPPLYVSTIQASERTGDLRQALNRYLVYHNQLDSVRKKIVSASIYPVLLILVGLLVAIFLMVYVVPRFSKVYEDMGNDLPLLSRALMKWGQLFEAYSGSISTALALLIVGLGYVLTRSNVRDWMQRKIWQIPMFGERLHLYQLARLYRTLGMLLNGGIPLVTALDMIAGILSQPTMRANLYAARQRISEGQPVSESMENCHLTTEVAYRMLRVGERSGNLGEMMEKIADFCDEETARSVEWFTRLFEPILMVFIGFIIGGIIILMYMPVFELAGNIQ